MPTNDFRVWGSTATGAGNAYSAAAYQALANLATGVIPGVADGLQANTSWRQATAIATMIAQFIVDTSGQNAVDDGTTTTLLANFKTGIQVFNAGRLLATTIFSTAGTFSWTPNALTTKVRFRAVGGGGSSGGTPTTAGGQAAVGGGGGSGSWLELEYTVASFTPGVNMVNCFVVGAGGVAVNGAMGGDGTSTTFAGSAGAAFTCHGGGGGDLGAATASGQTGGGIAAATSTQTNSSKIIILSSGNAGLLGTIFTPSNLSSGPGGGTPFGAGGPPVGALSNGAPGTGAGSGASGALAIASTGGTQPGVNGQAGIIIVEEFS